MRAESRLVTIDALVIGYENSVITRNGSGVEKGIHVYETLRADITDSSVTVRIGINSPGREEPINLLWGNGETKHS